VAVTGTVLASGLHGTTQSGYLDAASAGWWVIAGCGLCVLLADNDVLVIATTGTPTQSRTSFSASLGTTKDARKIGKSLFPVHRKATLSSSAASKV
jgi:hypothetical protein